MKRRYIILGTICLAFLVSGLDRSIISVAIPFIAKDFGLRPVAMGAVMSAFFLSYGLSQLLGGWLAEKVGNLRMMIFALLWWSIWTFFTGVAGGLVSMIWIRALFGLGEGLYSPAASATVANWFAPRQRGTAQGWIVGSITTGPAVAPVIAVVLIAAWGWRELFYVLFIPGLIMVVLTRLLVRENPAEDKRVSTQELAEIQERKEELVVQLSQVSYLNLIKDPTVLKIFAYTYFDTMVYWGFIMWIPSYLLRERGFSLAQMGWAASIPSLLGIFTVILGGWLSDRYFSRRRKVPMIIAHLCCAASLYCIYPARTAVTTVIFIILTGGLLQLASGLSWAIPMGVMPKAAIGRGMALVTCGGMLGASCAPLIMGYLVERFAGKFQMAFMFLIVGEILTVLCAATIKSAPANANAAISHGTSSGS